MGLGLPVSANMGWVCLELATFKDSRQPWNALASMHFCQPNFWLDYPNKYAGGI